MNFILFFCAALTSLVRCSDVVILNENLYYRKVSDGLCVVMERIVDDGARARLWQFSFEIMESGRCGTGALIGEFEQFCEFVKVWKANGQLSSGVVNRGIQSGAGDEASTTIRAALETFDSDSPVEL